MDRLGAEIHRRADDPLPGRRRLVRGQGIRDGQDGAVSGPLVAPPREEVLVRRLVAVREPAGLVVVFRLDRLTGGLRGVWGADAALPVAAGLAEDAGVVVAAGFAAAGLAAAGLAAGLVDRVA